MSKKSNKSSPRVTVLGGMNVDIISTFDSLAQLDDTKDLATNMGAYIGGSAANCAIALDMLSKSFNQACKVELITYRGNCPDSSAFDNKNSYAMASAAHHMLDILMDDIEIVDLIKGQSNDVGLNSVQQFDGGRHIAKQPIIVSPNINDNAKTKSLIEKHIKKSDYLFIDPCKIDVDAEAAIIAHKYGVPVVVDYGAKAWSEDPKEAARLRTIFEKSSIIIVPSDAVIEGMADGVKAPQELFTRLKAMSPHATIAMSDSKEPVQIYYQGQDSQIQITPVTGSIYTLGAGDTRNAGVLMSLIQGYDAPQAIERGSAIASVKIQYPDSSWAKAKTLRKHLGNHPLFSNDF